MTQRDRNLVLQYSSAIYLDKAAAEYRFLMMLFHKLPTPAWRAIATRLLIVRSNLFSVAMMLANSN